MAKWNCGMVVTNAAASAYRTSRTKSSGSPFVVLSRTGARTRAPATWLSSVPRLMNELAAM